MCFRLAVIGALSVMLTGCSGDRTPSPVLVRDSAGVTIVESHAPSWADGEGWTLSDEPVVTIGMEDGPDEYSLFNVRAALRLRDGTVVIANAGSNELRYYDSSGTFLYSVGNDGYGPGEFKMMSGVWLVSDTLVISDVGQDRVSLFSASGEYVRTVMLHREPGSFPPNGIGVFADGSILASTVVFDRHAASETGMVFRRVNAAYQRYSSDGAVLDSLGVFLFAEMLSETISTDRDASTGTSYGRSVSRPPPFGRRGLTVVAGDFMYHGTGDSYEIQVFSKDGALERIIRRPIPNPPVTDRDKRLHRENRLEDGSDWERRRVDELQYPETKPAYQAFTVDALGDVWIAENPTLEEDNVVQWTVFDPDGTMLGTVEVPKGGGIPNIGDDYLILVWRTELDVQQVRVYRLVKN